MKLVSFYHDGREGYGAIKDDGIVDLSGVMYQETHFANLKCVLMAGAGALTSLKASVDASAATFGLSDITFRMPIHNPSKIFLRRSKLLRLSRSDGRRPSRLAEYFSPLP